jgi:ferredoxin
MLLTEDVVRQSPAKRRIRIVESGEIFVCAESESLLQGMARIGRKGIPVGCLNGGCGVCKIKVDVHSVRRVGAMSRAHVTVEEENQGICLACRVAPLEAVDVVVLGKMKKAWGDRWTSALPEDGSRRRTELTKE